MLIKKLLLVFPVIAFLAAGCNSSQQAYNQTPVVQNTTPNPTPTQTNPSSTPTPATANTASKTTVNNVLPSGSIFTQGEGANIPLSWSVINSPAGATIYLDLLSSDGSESLGRITNNSDCTKGGDTIALATSVKSYKWDGLVVCSNWQAHSVSPGTYKLGVQLYSADGTEVIATEQSKTSFKIQK